MTGTRTGGSAKSVPVGGGEYAGRGRLSSVNWDSGRLPVRVSNSSLLLPAVALAAGLMNEVRRVADVLVVFLSVYGQDDTVAKALDMGATDCLVKSFSPTVLAARIRAVLRRRLGSFAGEPPASCQEASCVNKP